MMNKQFTKTTQQQVKRENIPQDNEGPGDSLAFVNTAGVKWTKNGKILVVIDHKNEQGQKLAVTMSPEYFGKALSVSLTEKMEN